MPRLEAEQALEIAKHDIVMKNIPSALAYCQISIEQDQTYYISYLFKAYCHINLQQYYVAINCLKDLLNKKPSNTSDNAIIHDAHLWMGFVYSKLNQHQFAISAFKLAIEVHAKDPNVYFYLGRELLLNNNFNCAIEAFKKAIEFQCLKPELDIYIAAAKFLMKTIQDRVVHYKKLAELYDAELVKREDHIDVDCHIPITQIKAKFLEIGEGKKSVAADDLAALIKLFHLQNESHDREVKQMHFSTITPLPKICGEPKDKRLLPEIKLPKPILHSHQSEKKENRMSRGVSFLFSDKESKSIAMSAQKESDHKSNTHNSLRSCHG